MADQTNATILRVTDQLQRALPFARFQFASVEFAGAGVDAAINHNLSPMTANDVGYIVVQQNAAGSVFQDLAAGRRAWTTSTIYLRSDTANLKAVLLIFSPAIPFQSLVATL